MPGDMSENVPPTAAAMQPEPEPEPEGGEVCQVELKERMAESQKDVENPAETKTKTNTKTNTKEETLRAGLRDELKGLSLSALRYRATEAGVDANDLKAMEEAAQAEDGESPKTALSELVFAVEMRPPIGPRKPDQEQAAKNQKEIDAILKTANYTFVDTGALSSTLKKFETKALALVTVGEELVDVWSHMASAFFLLQLASNSVIMVIGSFLAALEGNNPGGITNLLDDDNVTQADAANAMFVSLNNATGGDVAELAATITVLLGAFNAIMKGVDSKFKFEVREEQLNAKITQMKKVLGQLANLQADVAAVKKMKKNLKHTSASGKGWRKYMDPWAGPTVPKREDCVEYVREAVRVKNKVDTWVDNVWEDALLGVVGSVGNKAVAKKIDQIERMMAEHDVTPSTALHMAEGGCCNRRKYCGCCPGGICKPVSYKTMEDQSGLDGEGEKQDEGLTSLGNLYHKKVSELKKMAKNMGITEKDIDACDDHEDDTKDQLVSKMLGLMMDHKLYSKKKSEQKEVQRRV